MQHTLLGALCMQLRASSQVVSGMPWCEAARAVPRVATRAMSSLQEAYEGVLQYLEAAARGEVNAKDPIILAAIRSLARWEPSHVLTLGFLKPYMNTELLVGIILLFLPI